MCNSYRKAEQLTENYNILQKWESSCILAVNRKVQNMKYVHVNGPAIIKKELKVVLFHLIPSTSQQHKDIKQEVTV